MSHSYCMVCWIANVAHSHAHLGRLHDAYNPHFLRQGSVPSAAVPCLSNLVVTKAACLHASKGMCMTCVQLCSSITPCNTDRKKRRIGFLFLASFQEDVTASVFCSLLLPGASHTTIVWMVLCACRTTCETLSKLFPFFGLISSNMQCNGVQPGRLSQSQHTCLCSNGLLIHVLHAAGRGCT